MNKTPTVSRKRIRLILTVLLLVIFSAGGLGVWQTVQASKSGTAQATPEAASSYQTATVRKGDISITATGTGKAVATHSANLAFASGGTIAVLNVQLGDSVQAGQVLAGLDTTAALEQLAANAQLSLTIAQQNLDRLENNTAAALAQAQVDQAAAQQALASAKDNLHDPHDWRCPDSTTSAYYQTYLDAMVEARSWQALLEKASPVQSQYYQEHLTPILKKMDLAYLNYQYCQAYTPEEITASQANLQSAQANLDHAAAVLAALTANNGLDPASDAVARASVTNAELQLSQAKANLQAATLTAPIDGTVTALNGTLGQSVGTTTLITIVDTAQLAVQANLDEADLSNVALNCPAAVSFTMLSGKTFNGSLTTINPQLVSASGVAMVEVQITLAEIPNGQGPALGASAAVEVTCASAKDALTIPLMAVKGSAGNTGTVYVLNAQGQPKQRSVEMGINTGVTVEILTGLQEAEKVILSEVKVP